MALNWLKNLFRPKPKAGTAVAAPVGKHALGHTPAEPGSKTARKRANRKRMQAESRRRNRPGQESRPTRRGRK